MRSTLAIRQPVAVDPSSCSATSPAFEKILSKIEPKARRNSMSKQRTSIQSVKDGIRCCALYGRPLFAHYQLERKLDDSKLAVFAKRLVLSDKNHEKDLAACYSALGSRLQMGVILSSEAVPAYFPLDMAAWHPFRRLQSWWGEMYPCTRSLCSTLYVRLWRTDT